MNKLSSEVQDVDRCVNEKQNSDSGEMQKTTPCHPTSTASKDIQLGAGKDEAWPLVDVLRKLAFAAEHLGMWHDCDHHGYEEIIAAKDAAYRYLADPIIDSLQPERWRCACGHMKAEHWFLTDHDECDACFAEGRDEPCCEFRPITQDTKSAEGGNNPDDTVAGSLPHQSNSESSPSTSVSEAAPEHDHRPCTIQHTEGIYPKPHCANHYCSQPVDSVSLKPKAPSRSSVVVSGDRTESAALTPTPNNSVEHAAANNLAFLLSVIRCGESLSADEEAHVREVIERLGAISPFPLESDVQKKIVEIRERQARRSHWKQPRPNPRYPDPEPDIDTLLSIIDTLQRAIPLAAFESHKIDGRIAESISQCAASNMKAELIKRVREEMSGFTPESIERFAAKLEAVELTQDTESSEASRNPELSQDSPASSTESSVWATITQHCGYCGDKIKHVCTAFLKSESPSESESTLVTVDEVSKEQDNAKS